MAEKDNDIIFADAMQKADAATKAIANNKVVYNIQIAGNDGLIDMYYSTQKDDTHHALLKFKGYYVGVGTNSVIKNINDLVNIVKDLGLQELNVEIPWHRVMKIMNVSERKKNG